MSKQIKNKVFPVMTCKILEIKDQQRPVREIILSSTHNIQNCSVVNRTGNKKKDSVLNKMVAANIKRDSVVNKTGNKK